MAEDPATERDLNGGEWADDPIARALEIDALMAGSPADLPPIIVLGDDAIFGIRPIRRTA